MNQIEINKIVTTLEGEVYWKITDTRTPARILLSPSQMKELKEKMDKLEI